MTRIGPEKSAYRKLAFGPSRLPNEVAPAEIHFEILPVRHYATRCTTDSDSSPPRERRSAGPMLTGIRGRMRDFECRLHELCTDSPKSTPAGNTVRRLF